MKIARNFLLCLIFFSTLAAFFSEAFAEDVEKKERTHVSIGYNQYYMWWDPVWSITGLPTIFKLVGTQDLQELTISRDSSFVYNPIISINIPGKWSISGSFQYGEFSSNGSNYGILLNGPAYLYNDRKVDVKKYDAELLVQYNISDWCKIYAGPKYQGYRISDRYFNYNITNSIGYPLIDNIRFHSFGAGIGSGFTVFLGKGVYLLPNVSGIILYGRDFEQVNPLMVWMLPKAQDSLLIGGIGDLSFAYFIDKIRTTITAGFKCQYLYYTKTPRKEHKQKYDIIFGPHLGFVVTI